MIGAELIAELDESSRNLNTSPYTVSNLQGDLYDYHFIVFCQGDASGNNLEIIFNSDTSSNYRRYRTRGNSSTADASTTDSRANIELNTFSQSASSRGSLAMFSVTGSSGDERKASALNSVGSGPRVQMTDGYWKNTAD